ncbi:geranylgeranyl diphosphate synthase type III [Penicillium cataractarum]|uniref:Geranylgeranyl diphosphate synthase type III n=1 Tax=Penicillium cataractarum TaxID=2100454 RepID=A0A9W9SME6_9EURO|nr:geranylgeranyl diphosphate synthase type III [Penicillium cataractarum]KAJ5381156.1 geranylgeranyl diphosphate synthase type III [Penicillium cataractarum]
MFQNPALKVSLEKPGMPEVIRYAITSPIVCSGSRNIVTEPFEYLSSNPGKNIRSPLMNAFNE